MNLRYVICDVIGIVMPTVGTVGGQGDVTGGIFYSVMSWKKSRGGGPTKEVSIITSLVQKTGFTRRSPNVGSLMDQRRRRWVNIETTLGERFVNSL